MKGFRFLDVGENRSARRKTTRAGNRQTKLTYNHWLAALVKGKCSSAKPTRLAVGVSDMKRRTSYVESKNI